MCGLNVSHVMAHFLRMSSAVPQTETRLVKLVIVTG